MEQNGEKKYLGFLDVIIAVGIFAVSFAMRFGNRVSEVFDWDNVQYLLALQRYDLLAHQPHPPGHPLFVFVGWIFALVFGDGQLGLTILTDTIYSVGAVCLFFLGRKIKNFKVGMIAVLIYIFSPMGLFFTSFPNTFSIEAGMTSILWLALMGWIKGEERKIPTFWLGILLGVLSGFRMSFLIFAMPAVLYIILVRHPKGLFHFIIGLVIATGFWFVPMVVLTGGIGNYLLAIDAESAPFLRGFNLVNIKMNLEMLWKGMFGLMNVFWIIAVIYGVTGWIVNLIIREKTEEATNRKVFATALALWVIPSIVFFIVNSLHPGYLFFYLPLLAIGVGAATTWVICPRHAPFSFASITIGIIVMLIFCGTLSFNWKGNRGEFFSKETLRISQERLKAWHDEIRDKFPVENTVIVSWEHFRDTGWAIPESYVVWPQCAYSDETGFERNRANIYLSHNHKTIPNAFHLVRDSDIAPIVLPENIEFLVVSEADYNCLKNQAGFEMRVTSVGEHYFWKRVNTRIAIGGDYQSWYILTPEKK